MANISIQQQFKYDCKLINLLFEYKSCVGNSSYISDKKWAIVTNLSAVELKEKYGDIIAEYEPYIIINMEQYMPIKNYHSNERKYAIRFSKKGDAFSYEDNVFEVFHPEIITDTPKDTNWKWLYKAINKLPKRQRSRIYKRFFLNMTNIDIANQEGTTVQAINQSVNRAIQNLYKLISEID